ncbi:MAG: SGNH/GDSL hydrolase family protein [Promethearchaeota archaeon]
MFEVHPAWWVPIGLLLAFLVILLRAGLIARKLPIKRAKNSPRDFLARPRPEGKVVVCAGDSITHGLVSVNYVDILERRLGERGFTFVNAGVNYEMAFNLYARLDEIVACKPDIVTVMIGTNDVNCLVNKRPVWKYVRDRGLPREPSKEWYREVLAATIRKLEEETDARVGVFSLPVIGEDPGHPAFLRVLEYNDAIREVVGQTSATYLPLGEAMVEYLEAHPTNQKHGFDEQVKLLVKSVFRRYFFGTSFDKIGEENGFRLLVDHLHLNGRGAEMVANLAEEFILDKKDRGNQ